MAQPGRSLEEQDEDAFFANLLEEAGLGASTAESARSSTSSPLPVLDVEELRSAAGDSSFTSEDKVLRAALLAFYQDQNPENMAGVTSIVKKYRGAGIAELWVQMGIKYNLEPVQVIDFLSRTLYLTSIFESSEEDGNAESLERSLQKLVAAVVPGQELAQALADSSESLVRLLVFRGIQDRYLRPACWKLLLGYAPLHALSSEVLAEKRAEYMALRSEFVLESGGEFIFRQDPASIELVGILRSEVQRAESTPGLVQQPDVLLRLLYVYARANPDAQYVQGMSEMAAVILMVMGQESEFAEADAFGCFKALLAEFEVNVERATGVVHNLLGSTSSVLSRYDPELAGHFAQVGFEPGVVATRWFLLLFARDVALPDLLRWWDSLLADPRRFELLGDSCLAMVLDLREELLGSHSIVELVDRLQAAPRDQSRLESCLRKAWALSLLQRRTQAPVYPPLSTAEAVQDMASSFFSGIFKNF